MRHSNWSQIVTSCLALLLSVVSILEITESSASSPSSKMLLICKLTFCSVALNKSAICC